MSIIPYEQKPIDVEYELKTESGKKYSYSANDLSICDQYFIPYIVPLFLKLIPYQLPANIITIVSNSLVLLAYTIAMQSARGNYMFWFAIPILIFCYIIGDCMDGEQARRTKTGSPLGEFLDHFLDCFVTGELVISLLVVYNIKNAIIVMLSLTIAYLVQAVAFWERYKTGHMHFSRISSTEAIIGLTTLITIGVSKKIRTFAAIVLVERVPLFESLFPDMAGSTGLTVAEAFILGFSLMGLINIVLTLIRTKGVSVRFICYVILSFIVAAISSVMHQDTLHLPYLTIALFNIHYISTLLSSIVTKTKDHWPDFFLAIFMSIMFLLRIQNEILTTFYFLYVLVSVGIRASWFFVQNRQYWVWKNPEPQEKSSD
jgi:ethanolaminephosphotransferase